MGNQRRAGGGIEKLGELDTALIEQRALEDLAAVAARYVSLLPRENATREALSQFAREVPSQLERRQEHPQAA